MKYRLFAQNHSCGTYLHVLTCVVVCGRLHSKVAMTKEKYERTQRLWNPKIRRFRTRFDRLEKEARDATTAYVLLFVHMYVPSQVRTEINVCVPCHGYQ